MSKVNFDIVTKYSDKGIDQAEKSLKALSQTAEKQGKEGGKGYAKGFSKNAEQSVDRAEKALKTLSGVASTEGKDGGRKYGSGFGANAEKGVDDAWRSVKGLTAKAEPEGKESGTAYGVGFSKGIGGLGGRVSGFMRTSLGKAAGIGAGLLAGGGFVAAFQDAMEQGDLSAKLQVQLGLTDKQSAKAGRIAGDLYQDNFGESVGAVNDTIRKIVQDTEVGINSLNLKPLTAKIITVTESFEQETGQVTRAAGQLVRTGLARNVGQAIDLITRGFQKGADKSEDFLDTLNEYSTLFRDLGLTGKRSIALLVQGVEAGARDSDKVADALKEFSIRIKDGSDLTRDSLKALGIDAKATIDTIARGGPKAAGALGNVLEKLRGVKDPAKRAQIAVGLFGAQAEDLGKALFALNLDKADRAMGKFAGSAKRAVNAVGGTANAKVQTFIKTMKQDLVEGLAAAIESFQTGVVKGKGFARTMSEAGTVIRTLVNDVKAIAEKFAALPGPIKSAALSIGAFLLIRNQFPAFGAAISRNIITPFRGAPSAVGGFKASIASTGKMLLRGGLWGIAIGVAGAALTSLFGKFFEAKQRVDQLTEALKADAGAIRATTKAAIANMLVEDGLADSARRAGVSFELVTRAALGQIDAQRQLELELKDVDKQMRFGGKTLNQLTAAEWKQLAALKERRKELVGVINKTHGLDKTLQKSKRELYEQKVAQEAVNAALGKGSGALDRNTKQGQKNIDKLKNMAKGAIETARSMDKNGRSHDVVTGKMEKARQKFIATAIKMGASREEARRLADKLRLIPGKYKAVIEANTNPAERAISRFIETQDGRKINLNVQGFGSGTPGIATGGPIHGPGTGTSDTAGLFRLSNGEHVWTAKEVERAGGHGAIERMRSMAKSGNLRKMVPGMAAGGPVTLDVRSTGLDALREKITQALTVPQVSGVPSSVGGNAAIVKSIFASMFGWASHWPSTYSLLMKESGFRNTAQNPTSTAYGMFQFLDSTWGGYGIPKTSDPRLQTIAGGRYIAGRYGNPSNALAFHLRNNWYDKGGMLQSGRTAVNKSGKPERVLSPRQTNAFERLVDNLLGGVKQSDAPLRRQLKQLNRTLFSLSRLLRKADRDWFADRTRGSFRRRMVNLLKRRERIDDRLEKAISVRDKRVAQRREVAGGLRSGIFEQRNLVGGFGIDHDGSFSAGDIAGQLEKNLAKTRRFQRLLRKMRRQGFRANVIGQVAQAGPEEGFDTAKALANARGSEVRRINQSFVGIHKAATNFSKEMGRKLYGAGIQAARGVVRGLRDRRRQIQRTMRDIARGLIKAMKDALEMRSPSKVLQRMGALSADSYMGAFGKGMSPKSKAARQMLRHLRKGGGVFEDFSFRGMSGLGDRFNEQFSRQFHRSGQKFTRGNVEKFLQGQARGNRGGDVHIHLHIDKQVNNARQLAHELRQLIRNNQTLRRELGLA